MPFTLVHFPQLPNSKFAGKTGYGDFPEALAEMDAHVGEILDAIDDLRIRDNTVVVFTSDNGPEATWPWQGSSGGWRGYYFTHMEGSVRTPFIIRWPNRIPAGRVSNKIVHEVDISCSAGAREDRAAPEKPRKATGEGDVKRKTERWPPYRKTIAMTGKTVMIADSTSRA